MCCEEPYCSKVKYLLFCGCSNHGLKQVSFSMLISFSCEIIAVVPLWGCACTTLVNWRNGWPKKLRSQLLSIVEH